ncbi:hypothetical protein C8F04DRAFT_451704 [Mycena alexandri]|uniref:Uncharacterized protein n=1 Tax=Mycena alexandri TaxID=1745969 RepID=A0AAD6TID5_9AGAR|nr:hypothetical protein C8F04DRAFT_451704 [Mycena alexandri]
MSSSSSTRGGVNGGENNGGNDHGGGGNNIPPFFPPFFPPPPPQTFPPPRLSTSLAATTSSAPPSSSSESPSASGANLMMFNQPTGIPPPHGSKSTLPLGLIVGTSVGALILGGLLVALFFLGRRRRAQQVRRAVSQNDEEKQGMLETPPITPPRNAKVVDWIRRNRVSVSSISSFSSPTVLESVGGRTSFSEYSQASALASGTSGELGHEDGVTRPPWLYRAPGLDQIKE